jgi:hypothetical protein
VGSWEGWIESNDFQIFQKLAQLFELWGFLGGVIGAHDLANDFVRKLAQLRAEAVFVITAEIAHDLLEIDGEIKSLFVNGEMLVLGHGYSLCRKGEVGLGQKNFLNLKTLETKSDFAFRLEKSGLEFTEKFAYFVLECKRVLNIRIEVNDDCQCNFASYTIGL